MTDLRIAAKYLPPRAPGIMQWFVIITCLHYWSVPGWALGAILSLYGLVTITLWVVGCRANYVHPAEVPKENK